MAEEKLPQMYKSIRERYGDLFTAVDEVGRTVRNLGPLNEKTSHLVQLAAAAAIRSEGAVHSHVRRALEAGAEPDEVYHAIVLLTNTIGFPAMSAALSWADDIIRK
jgi:alkylhydroperoxidase/carboxymuconolactone decarboxylase family protein YurZ